MDTPSYVVRVEDHNGQTSASSFFESEAEARHEVGRGLMNPDYQGCDVWLSYPDRKGREHLNPIGSTLTLRVGFTEALEALGAPRRVFQPYATGSTCSPPK